MNEYDVLVVGAGPGGYVAAIRAAQLGLKTAVAERWINDKQQPVLGGTCLNVGCIPSKSLLDSSHLYRTILKDAQQHGITVNNTSINIQKMMQRKERVVQMLTQGVAGLFKKNQIDWLQGSARFLTDHSMAIESAAGVIEVNARYIIIATGSVPATLEVAPVSQRHIVDSTGALAFEQVPQKLGIIGAGVIGLELGSVWNRLGSEVTVLEAQTEFLPTIDRDVATELQKQLRKQGLKIHLGCRLNQALETEHNVSVHYQDNNGEQSMEFDKLIVAIGRQPNTQGLGLDQIGLSVDERGCIPVDEQLRTSVDHIYAVGDVIHGPMLAHKASEDGVAAAEHIAGKPIHLDHNLVPWVIYTWPEVAWVGKTEQQLLTEGRSIKTGDFPFSANGRARAMGETSGLVKVISDAHNDELLGVHIVGANASELIAEAVTSMTYSGSAEDIARTIHAHPTLSEALHEAALATDGRRIHL